MMNVGGCVYESGGLAEHSTVLALARDLENRICRSFYSLILILLRIQRYGTARRSCIVAKSLNFQLPLLIHLVW